MSKTTAIVIGVDSYPQLSPPQSLCSACNDAIHWTSLLINGLNISPSQIQLLVAPADGASVQDRAAQLGLAPENVRGAALTDALAAVDDLKTRLSASENKAATGIIVFSGHGAQVAAPPDAHVDNVVPGQLLAMAMSDAHLDGEHLEGVLMYVQLNALLSEDSVRARVTVIVDACYSMIGAQRPENPQQPQNPAGSGPASKLLGTRLMLGASPGGPAWQGWLGQEWRGVFSFALINLLGQWRTTTTPEGVTVVLGSYREIMFRTRELMGVLGYDDQSPELAGTPLARAIPFNNPSLTDITIPAVFFPDSNRKKKEIIGDTGTLGVYTFSLTDGTSSTNIAQCLWSAVSGTITVNISTNNNPTIAQNAELWFMNTGDVPVAQNQLVINYTAYTPPTNNNLAFTVASGLSTTSHSTSSTVAQWGNETSTPSGTWYGPLLSGTWMKLVWQTTNGTYNTNLQKIKFMIPPKPTGLILGTGTFPVGSVPNTMSTSNPWFSVTVDTTT